MDDLDDLDNALFGKHLKGKESRTSGETKKKVMFKDIDENDPLKDLIFSDEEDFQESLEENPVNPVKDSKISDLFGIKPKEQPQDKDSVPTRTTTIDNSLDNKSPLLPTKNLSEKAITEEPVVKESDFPLPATNSPVAPKSNNPAAPIKSSSKMKSLFDDNDDITSNLGERPKPPASAQAKKSSLMEDLFGNRPKSSTVAEISRRKPSFNIDTPLITPNPTESLTGLTNENLSKTQSATGFSLSVTREPRRGRRASAGPMVQNDPLGLLSASTLQLDEPKIEEKPQVLATDTAKPTVNDDLPEWLGGPKVSKEQKQVTEKSSRSEIMSSAKSSETMLKTSNSIEASIGLENVMQSGLTSKLLGMEFDQQAALVNMQQQEHELRTATALSQQNEKLNYMLEIQKMKLTEQEKQFNMLIARQLERQNLLETQMKAQQERIDNYIQSLAAQPSTLPTINLSMNKEFKLNSQENNDEKAESESLVQKLQIEKLYLENTLESLREKHEKEISIMEDSYKKQVTFLEEAIVHLEKRMQDDVECLEADYKTKIQKLKEEIFENEKNHKIEKENLKEEHSKCLQEIQDRHLKSMEVLQKEHSEIIERLTKSKESERQAIEIMKIDGSNVQNILNKSQFVVEGLENLQKKFESRDHNFVESQDNHLTIQEKNIEYLKELLEKQREAFTEEKQKLLVTVQKLESDTSELIREFNKHNINFKESGEIIKYKEQALLKEREIFVEQTNWERERIQAMRDAWSKEEDRQLAWLAQERQALAAERGKLQIFNRLKIGDDESSKIELEATIRAAQEAAASANQERLKWQEKINEIELQERAIKDKESRLIAKAKELQEFTQAALAKREEGMKALQEAHFIEERYKEKFIQLQKQQEMLNQRESKLATEKLELAKTRLLLRISDAEKPERDVINKVENAITREDERSLFSEVPSSTQQTTYFKDIVDPNIVLLKLDLDDKLGILRDYPFTTSH